MGQLEKIIHLDQREVVDENVNVKTNNQLTEVLLYFHSTKISIVHFQIRFLDFVIKEIRKEMKTFTKNVTRTVFTSHSLVFIFSLVLFFPRGFINPHKTPLHKITMIHFYFPLIFILYSRLKSCEAQILC